MMNDRFIICHLVGMSLLAMWHLESLSAKERDKVGQLIIVDGDNAAPLVLLGKLCE